jgi:hypothetical protein
MKDSAIIRMLTLFVMVLVLTGWDSYRASSLPMEIPSFISNQVIVVAKAYTKEECKANLHRDLLDRGYRPIQVTVQNNTSRFYSFSEESVSLRCTHPRHVALKVSARAIPRAIGYRVASFLFWPFMIPSTIDSIRTYKAHKDMKKDFTAKGVKEKEEIILPYSTVTRILFIKDKDFQEDFTVSLMDFKTDELTNYRCHLDS